VKALSRSLFLFWRPNSLRDQAAGNQSELDGLEAFAAEGDAGSRADAAPRPTHAWNRWIIGALAGVALVEAPAAGLWLYEQSRDQSVASAPLPPQPVIYRAHAPVNAPIVPGAIEPGVRTPSAANVAPSSRASADERDAPSPAAVGGWVSVKTPVPMEVFEEGRLIGTTEVDRIMLPVGTHRLEFVSDSLGYRSRQEVAIRAGQTSAVRLDLPTGALALNALPWAEVWVDGERVGETPIGNLTRTIGPHEVVFRHPDLGEKKTIVVVTLKEPARVGVDLRSKS
jgi:hypothetical protein